MLKDKLINKVTGRNVETISISLEQMVELINEYFISKAETKEELDQIWKVAKGPFWFRFITSTRIESKDGNLELICRASRRIIRDATLVQIHQKDKDVYFEHKTYGRRKYRKRVKEAINAAKMKFSAG